MVVNKSCKLSLRFWEYQGGPCENMSVLICPPGFFEQTNYPIDTNNPAVAHVGDHQESLATNNTKRLIVTRENQVLAKDKCRLTLWL